MARSPLTAVKTTPRPGDANANANAQPTNPYANNRPAVVNLVDLDFTLDETCVRLRGYRHTLQRTFLGKQGPGGVVDVEELAKCDAILHDLAQVQMTPDSEYLRQSKIHKVMQRIRDLKDGEIPSESEEKYSFRKRARAYVDAWNAVLGIPSDEQQQHVAASDSALIKPHSEEQQQQP